MIKKGIKKDLELYRSITANDKSLGNTGVHRGQK